MEVYRDCKCQWIIHKRDVVGAMTTQKSPLSKWDLRDCKCQWLSHKRNEVDAMTTQKSPLSKGDLEGL